VRRRGARRKRAHAHAAMGTSRAWTSLTAGKAPIQQLCRMFLARSPLRSHPEVIVGEAVLDGRDVGAGITQVAESPELRDAHLPGGLFGRGMASNFASSSPSLLWPRLRPPGTCSSPILYLS